MKSVVLRGENDSVCSGPEGGCEVWMCIQVQLQQLQYITQISLLGLALALGKVNQLVGCRAEVPKHLPSHLALV